jgi:tripartite-type tricarboxylate transporter receptor subunit TctC
MPLSRCVCAIGAGAVVLMCVISPVSVSAGEDWPTHPIRILVGFGAGGGTDVATRIIADPLGEVLGQRIVVENKAGAAAPSRRTRS